MTFKVGDRVRLTGSNWPTLSSRSATIIERTPTGYALRVDDYAYDDSKFKDYHHATPNEIEIIPEWAEAIEYEESHPASEDFSGKVSGVLSLVKDTLIAKNKAYGNSALEPVRVFSTADPVEQLRVRIDDKLSRLKSSLNNDNEDTVLDLMGYLVLLRIATRKQDDNG